LEIAQASNPNLIWISPGCPSTFWNFHPQEFAGRDFIHCGLHERHILFQGRPVVCGQKQDGNFAASEILLILQVTVAGEK
jgi:hypothetical protein